MPPATHPGAASATQSEGHVTREFQFLLDCCASVTGRTGTLHPLPSPVVDWQSLGELAERHNVTPLLFAALSRIPQHVPPAYLEPLRQAYHRNAQKNLRLALELTRILDSLELRSIEAIPYKGPALAETAYGDIALRQFWDLDVLVRARDLAPARLALRELGYAPSKQYREPEQRALLATGYECAFDGPAGTHLLELQWRLLPRFYAIDLELDDLFSRAVASQVAGTEVRALSAEDLLLVICLHTAKHAWAQLSWLCDIAATVSTQAIDYTQVVARAEHLGVTRIIGVSLWLVEHLLHLPLPASVNGLVTRDPEIPALGRAVLPIIYGAAEYDTGSAAYFRLMLRARERRRDRFRFLWRLALTPSEAEWAVVRLPAPFFPLYRLVRLGRLAGRLFSRNQARPSGGP